MFNPTMLSEVPPQNLQTANMVDNSQTTQKVLSDLKGELDAIIEYNAHITESTNEIAKKTWKHIRDEELHHVGKLLGLLEYLSPTFKTHVNMGKQEFQNELNPQPTFENM